MKSVIKISNIEFHNDIKIIRDFISNNSGIIASKISLTKKEITLIYNDPFFILKRSLITWNIWDIQ